MENPIKGELYCAQNVPKTKYINGLIWNSFVSYQSTKKYNFLFTCTSIIEKREKDRSRETQL